MGYFANRHVKWCWWLGSALRLCFSSSGSDPEVLVESGLCVSCQSCLILKNSGSFSYRRFWWILDVLKQLMCLKYRVCECWFCRTQRAGSSGQIRFYLVNLVKQRGKHQQLVLQLVLLQNRHPPGSAEETGSGPDRTGSEISMWSRSFWPGRFLPSDCRFYRRSADLLRSSRRVASDCLRRHSPLF